MARKRTPDGWFYYKRKHLYLGIKQIDKEIAFENLSDFLRILHKEGLRPVAGFGTLLGIIRDNDFITWDEDIDLCILEEDEIKLEKSLEILRKGGFELVRYERIGLYSFTKKGEYIDIYVLQDIGEGVRNCGMDFLFEADFSDTATYNFKGIEISIPRQYERHLEFLYGDWKTPVQYADFNLSKLQKQISRLKIAFKNSLPDFLFYPMLHRHHRGNLEKFLQKCEKKGIAIDKTKIKY